MPGPLVVSFYTDDRYREKAERLALSCDKVGLDCEIDKMPDQGKWVHNCAMKASYLRDKMEVKNCPLLWVDADGWFQQSPELLIERPHPAPRRSMQMFPLQDFAIFAQPGKSRMRFAGCTEAVHLPPLSPGWFKSGTMWFNDTGPAMELLIRWSRMAMLSLDTYDQHALQEAWAVENRDFGLTTLWLPMSYCYIHRMFRRKMPLEDAVIVHDLASTEFKTPDSERR